MTRLFYSAYQAIAKNRLLGLFVFVIMVAGLVFLATRLQFEEDISKLIPANEKSEEVQQVLKSVNFTDKIIVNIRKKPNASTRDLTQYASRFVDSLEKNNTGYIQNIQGKVEDDVIAGTLDFLYKNAPLFLNETDYKAIAAKLKKDSIAAITQANFRTMVSPTGIVAKKQIRRDPLGISFLALEKLNGLGMSDQLTVRNGFLVSRDEQNLLLFITPKYPSSETDKNEAFAEELYKLQHQLNTTFENTVEGEYFGAVLIAVANAQQIKKDIQFTVGIAMTVLIVIFIVFYRKITIPLILFTPTVFGGLLSVALLYLIRSEISAISLGIGSVLLGVTLDYSLHILTHLRNREPIEKLYRDITKPILMSSLTTAMAFLCLLFLDSQALQDLGIFAAVSVLGASVFALLFIPQVYKGKNVQIRKPGLLDRLAAFHFHKSKWLLGIIAIFSIVSLFTYNKVVFNKDISKLNYEPEAATLAKQHLDALTNLASKSIYIAAFGDDTQKALEVNDTVHSILKELDEKDEILSYNSVGALVFSEAVQQQKIARWQSFWDEATVSQTKQSLIESGADFGLKPTTFQQFYSFLESDFTSVSVSDYSAITSFSVADFISEKEGITTVTSLVKVDEPHIEKVHNAFKDEPNVLAIDRQEMNETLLGTLKDDFNSLIGYSMLVVLALLLLFFRSFSLTLVTAVPIFLTWFITIGVMGLLGIEFNIFNIIISTFIFGLGVDYCIFITNGMLTEYRTGNKALSLHKTSIVLSVITTILGVGVLIFAKHPALYSISVVSIIGIFSAMLVSFSIQPLLFRLFIGSRTKRPITFRLLLHSALSFTYYGLGGLVLSSFSVVIMPLIPWSKKRKMKGFHWVISKFMKSVLYTNPFVRKEIVNQSNETFEKPGIIIANHTSFLDILAVGMLHPKIIFLVNDWVYNSPIFGKAVQLAGFYPVSGGIDKGVDHLKIKVAQGYTLMAFPEGTRSSTNKIRRFHKGAFFLAEQLDLDIIPVLIHGNSEVLPKGSFVIRDGSITVKILERISAANTSFGTTYKERTKQISNYFKTEFDTLRTKIEDKTYFHDLVRLEYRYKGDALYRQISKDLKSHKATYKEILEVLDKRCTVTNISNGNGQLDFLLLMDSADRKITTYIPDATVREIVQNSFITAHHNKITFANSKEKALAIPSEYIIIETNDTWVEQWNNKRNADLNFQKLFRDEKLSIFKKSRIS
ncbi:1-acyl-sn-glycerol-3-phosphate acyltransferase [Marinirhabdus gelatinilytica]|uniref:Phospholipid/glycerol acyltransferase domain-containing protein n=1 Tax=Marinirhabdus gelatinilytica TaxID=1703343 RepID=A0A370QKA0_9FLAO|nr:1-acyl-sn-glycerol-3-phosphate acyltransferase [Marinirhabdus gelatinilytica]RDK88751.1 hypothetical protein C8D94_101628 [Marinirhabdus gelatinilytica]